MYSKAHPIRDEMFRMDWAERHLPDGCQACGTPGNEFYRWLEVHHIIRGFRSDEPCNLLLLCKTCHDLHHGHKIRVSGQTFLPRLTFGMILTVKAERDPDEYDAERLTVLRGNPLPEPEPLADWFLSERARYKR